MDSQVGSFKGTYFFSAIRLTDGTGFRSRSWSIPGYRKSYQVSSDLSSVDTNYTKLRVGMIGLTNNSIITRVVAERAADSASVEIYVEGSALEEALLEELAILPTTYTSADAIEFYDNCLYLGNVTSATEDTATFQGYANQIQPIWEIKKGQTSFAGTNVLDDPQRHAFMPDGICFLCSMGS